MLANALHTAFVAGLVVYVGHAGAVCAGLASGTLRRWAAACVLAPAALIAIFNALATFGLYDAANATITLAAVATVLRGVLWHRDAPGIASLLEQDRDRLARMARPLARGPWGVLALVLLLATSLTIARAMVHPPLAWDSLTYHAVKAVMWLQSGGALPLVAPGGWSTHAGRLAGADVVTSWAMLAGPGDAVWGAADVFWWLALAVGLLFLSSELGLRVRDRIAIMTYGCLLPATLLAIGSGYVEVAVAATTCLALGLLCHAHRTASPGALAVGVIGTGALMSMKLIVWPGVALLGLFSLFIALHRRSPPSERGLPALAWGATFAAVVALPGFVRNLVATGYPLSVPLRVGPLVLGPPNAELDHLEATFSAMIGHGLAAELEALAWSFGSPLRIEPQLTVTALPVLALAVFGIVRETRRGRAVRARALWIAAVLGAMLASWLSPALETVRLHWMQSNARHLLPALMPLLPFAFVALRGDARKATVLRLALVGSATAHAVLCIAYLWLQGVYRGAEGPAAIVLFLILLVGFARSRARGRGRLAPRNFAAIGLSVAVGLGFFAYRASPSGGERTRFGAQSPLGAVPKYWADAAAMTDDPAHPYTIALTSGVEPAADNWFMYPFLGVAHQNRLVHARVTEDGPLPPLAPGHGRTARARFDVWWRNLRALEADWVMAFHPEALELAWMEAHPDLFEWRAGDRRTWGLYRIRREPVAD